MSNTADFTVTPDMSAKQIGVMFRRASKRAKAFDAEVTIPFRHSLGLRVIAEKAAGVTATELAEAIGCSNSLLSNAKQVAEKYPTVALATADGRKTWEDIRASLKGASDSAPATSKDKAHAALESDELTNAQFCQVVTAAAGKRSLTAKQRTDLIATLQG